MNIFNNLKKKFNIGLAFNFILLKNNLIKFFIIESYKLSKKEKKNFLKYIKKYKFKSKIYFLTINNSKNFDESFFSENKNLIIYKTNLSTIKLLLKDKCSPYHNKINLNKKNMLIPFLIRFNILYNGEVLDYFKLDYCKHLTDKIQDEIQLYLEEIKKIDKNYSINVTVKYHLT